MRRVSLLVDETATNMIGVSLEARGLYLTLCLCACQWGGDDIELGKPQINYTEPTPELLGTLLETTPERVKELLKELEKAGFLSLKPLVLRRFRDDNEPYLSRRRSNISNPRRSTNPNETQTVSERVSFPEKTRKDKIRIDKIRKDKRKLTPEGKKFLKLLKQRNGGEK